MLNKMVPDRYSDALMDIALEQDKLDRFLNDLEYVWRTLEQYQRLKQAIMAPNVRSEAKKEILEEIFGADIDQYTLFFLYLLVDMGREIYLEQVIKIYRTKVNILRNTLEAEIVMAIHPPPGFTDKIRSSLEHITGKKMEITTRRDPSLIGGFQIIVRDDMIDYSLRGQINRMRKNFRDLYVDRHTEL